MHRNNNKQYLEIMNNPDLAYLKLNLKFDTNLFIKELNETAKKHFNSTEGWANLGLHAIDKDKARPYTNYGYKSEDEVPYQWTEFGNECKNIKEFITKNFKAKKYYRIKANLLHPKTLINAHTDSRKKGLGLTEHSPYNDPDPYKIKYVWIALDWPKEVIFNVGNYRLPIKNGDIFLMNFGMTHEVYHPGKKIRSGIVLTADFTDSKEWEKLVCDSYVKNKNIILPKKKSLLIPKIKKRLSNFLNV